jgi:uncharacterized protein (TIGR00297 family)
VAARHISMAHTIGIAHRAHVVVGVLAISPRFRLLGRAFTIAVGIAWLAYHLRFLTRSGAFAASIVGIAVFAGTGTRGSLTLMSYFVTSSLLGRLPRGRAPAQQRGNQRDAVQVFANGGIPAILASVQFAKGTSIFSALEVAFASAVAAATADTWATEIGGRYGANPRSIVTGRHVSPGTSGGVSVVGLGAAAAGSVMVAATAISGNSGHKLKTSQFSSFVATSTAGIAGSLADSLAGATFQEVRFCGCCLLSTEHLVHDCGNKTRLVRGVPGWNNDVTNVVGILSGVIVGIGMAKLLSCLVRQPREQVACCLQRG